VAHTYNPSYSEYRDQEIADQEIESLMNEKILHVHKLEELILLKCTFMICELKIP
jgi:hypothetical protein